MSKKLFKKDVQHDVILACVFEDNIHLFVGS